MPGTALKGKVSNTDRSVQEVTTSVAGSKTALDVNVVAGASGGVSDSTAANQATQIGIAQTIRDSSTVNVNWDYYDLTYVASGNGQGQVETITYYTGSPGSGTQVLQLTYTYDLDDNVSRVVRS